MSELWINSRGREIEVTKDRAELFRYLGKSAAFDHVAIYGVPSLKIFSHYKDFDLIAEYCEEEEYPQAINQVHVGDPVKWYYERSIYNRCADVSSIYLRDDHEVQQA